MNIDFLEPISFHKENWAHINSALKKGLYPQSSLYVAARHAKGSLFVTRLALSLLCRGNDVPCGTCAECERFLHHVHPDFIKIEADGKTGIIKIDQIRDLCERVIQTPKRGKAIVVTILSADRLNAAAANALLKILEEPPRHVYFILLAEQTRSIPATILSRCQIRSLASPFISNYLSLAEFYTDTEERAKLLLKQDEFITLLSQYLHDEIAVTTLSDSLSQYTIADVLWFLSLIISFLIENCLLNKRQEKMPWSRLCQTIHIPSAFKMLSQIYTLLEKLNHNININSIMALDHLFMLLKA